MSRHRTQIKNLHFHADQRRLLTFSSSAITIDAVRSELTLRNTVNSIGRTGYNTDDDHTVTTEPWVVNKLVSWRYIQFIFDTPTDDDGNEVTGIYLRLVGSSGARWWNGTEWEAPGADEWSTMEDVCNNISSWTDKTLGFVINLRTTDARYTPTLRHIKVAYKVDLPSFINDWILSSLIPALREEVQLFSEYVIEAHGGLAYTMSDYPLEASVDISDIVEAYDHANDPDHETNLFSSFASGVLTLSDVVPAGSPLWIRTRLQPTVAKTTNQDYDEIEGPFNVIIDEVREDDMGAAHADDGVINIYSDPPTGVIVPAPRRVNINLGISVTAPTAVDLGRLQDAVHGFFHRNRVLTSYATGDQVSMRPMSGNDDSSTSPNLSDLQQARMLAIMENAYKFLGEPNEEPYVVTNFAIRFINANTGASDTIDIPEE
jgi:hypothetical protein